jgi:hypothetical protein
MHVMTSCGMTVINKTGGSSVVHTARSHAALLVRSGDLNTVRAVGMWKNFFTLQTENFCSPCDFPLLGRPLVCFDNFLVILLHLK